jgi:hypothetical protein
LEDVFPLAVVDRFDRMINHHIVIAIGVLCVRNEWPFAANTGHDRLECFEFAAWHWAHLDTEFCPCLRYQADLTLRLHPERWRVAEYSHVLSTQTVKGANKAELAHLWIKGCD